MQMKVFLCKTVIGNSFEIGSSKILHFQEKKGKVQRLFNDQVEQITQFFSQSASNRESKRKNIKIRLFRRKNSKKKNCCRKSQVPSNEGKTSEMGNFQFLPRFSPRIRGTPCYNHRYMYM